MGSNIFKKLVLLVAISLLTTALFSSSAILNADENHKFGLRKFTAADYDKIDKIPRMTTPSFLKG